MKLELKENMYVRIEKGKIFKTDGDLIYLSNDKTILYKLITRIPHDTISYKVVKASYNIINILEERDYVNGYPICEIIEYEDDTKAIIIDDSEKTFIQKNEDIKSIVTHEQMEQMAYKVEE